MINIALVGAGGMGSVHYANYLEIENCRVVAIVGLGERDRAKASEWSVPCFESITQCLESVPVNSHCWSSSLMWISVHRPSCMNPKCVKP